MQNESTPKSTRQEIIEEILQDLQNNMNKANNNIKKAEENLALIAMQAVARNLTPPNQNNPSFQKFVKGKRKQILESKELIDYIENENIYQTEKKRIKTKSQEPSKKCEY